MNYAARLNRLRQHLISWECDILLIEHPIDLLYLTGLELSAGKLLIGVQNSCLFVDGRYSECSALQSLYPVQLLEKDSIGAMISDYNLRCVGFDQTKITYQRFVDLHQQLPNSKLIPLDAPVQQLRLIKDVEEILALKASARLAYQGYEYILSRLKKGISEKELALDLEFFWKTRGASRLAFESIIAFGENSSMPHHRSDNTVLIDNTNVLIDIGVMLAHYCSDMTRVHFFGTPPDPIRTIYHLVEEAKVLALAACRPGTMIGELDHIARSFLSARGYAKEFCHNLGHGIGLEVHEFPMIRNQGVFHSMPLEAGMVLTIEPGLYLPGIGGVRLEDTILITVDGYENLTQSILDDY